MRRTNQLHRVRGTTTIELLASFSLLTVILGAALPLVVRHGRILASADHYRIALEELSNQSEALAGVTSGDADEYLRNVKPSPFAVEHLPGAKLDAVVNEAEGMAGRWVVLSLTWDEPGRQAAPVSLATWLPSGKAAAAEEAAEEETP